MYWVQSVTQKVDNIGGGARFGFIKFCIGAVGTSYRDKFPVLDI